MNYDREKRNKPYKTYLQDDSPLEHVPRTTQWRLKKRLKLEQEEKDTDSDTDSSSAANVLDPDAVSNLSEYEEYSSAASAFPQTPKVAQDAEGYIDSESDDVWYNTETTGHWYQNHDEHSVWYDATEEPELSDHEEHITDNDDSDDTRIYIGAPITVAQSAILILSFAMRHNLTGECLSDLLTLISLHCITTNFLHLSLYRFRSYFSSLKAPLVFHKFCSKCEFLVEDSINECTVCSSDLSDKNNTSYFVEIPLLFQIQQLFQRSEFHHNLMHRFSRKKKIANNIEDIYDGELYKKYSHPGCFLDKSNNISFMWYTDGVPLFKSSKVSIWPLFFSINELPIQERFKRENMLFAGLWFGRSKPSMSCFLKPFHDSLNKFRDDGFEITCAHCSALITVKGMLLCGTCDLPAKCIVLNMTQFNGKHGCPKCKQEGNVIKTGKGHTRVFPFDACLIDGPKRNHEEFIQHGEEAFASSTPAFGVKGPSWWANCCPDIINGTAIDYMHSVLLGLVRRLLQLWFDPKYSCQSFSISNLVNVADKRLSLIKPPYFIHRHPRNIKEQSKYWKASECRAWLFFYSVPVLFGLLKQQFFQHYLLFVEAIYILNLDSISNDDLKHCEELLIKFSCIFSVLYGEQHMSANLHQMLHLHDTVKQLGPLWVYSCFSFESMNGKLVNLFHGTQNPVIQIANAVSTVLKLPALSHQIADATPIGQFFNKLTSTNSHYRITETICDGAYIIGGKHLKQLDDKYIATLSQSVHFAFGNCYMFYRILLNGVLYHSMKYNTYSRNSCTIVYKVHDIYYCGQIVFYVKLYPICHCEVTACKCTAVFLAVVQKIRLDKKCAFLQDNTDLVYAKLEHIYTGKITNECIAVSIEDIIGLGICVSFSHEKMCISLRPNTVESD